MRFVSRYFFSGFLQLQFFEGLCKQNHGEDVDIHLCDLYGSKNAGHVLRLHTLLPKCLWNIIKLKKFQIDVRDGTESALARSPESDRRHGEDLSKVDVGLLRAVEDLAGERDQGKGDSCRLVNKMTKRSSGREIRFVDPFLSGINLISFFDPPIPAHFFPGRCGNEKEKEKMDKKTRTTGIHDRNGGGFHTVLVEVSGGERGERK